MEYNYSYNQIRDDEIEINLKEIVMVFVRKLWLILLVGVIVGVAAGAYTKITEKPVYMSATKMYVLTKQDDDSLTSSDMQISSWLTKDYSELIMSRTVMENVIADLGLDMTPDTLSSKVQVYIPADTRIITIRAYDGDPEQARKIADAVREAASVRIKEVMEVENVNVVDVANLPGASYSSNVRNYGIIGAGIGMLIVIVILFIQYLINDTIKTAEDVEKYLQLSTLGMIPIDKKDSKSKKRIRKASKRR